MENFKRYFFIITLFVFASLSFLTTKIVINILLENMLPYEEVKIDQSKIRSSRSKNISKRDKNGRYIIEKNIFNSEFSFAPVKVETENINKNFEFTGDQGIVCQDSSIDVEIKATLPAEPKYNSYFAIIDPSSKNIKYYRLGDEFIEKGLFIYDVQRSVIVLDRNGIKECLYANREKKDKKKNPYTNKDKSSDRYGNRSGSRVEVKQTGNNSYDVDAENLNKELKNLNRLARDARIVPAFDKKEPGKSIGFKIFAIKRGTLFEKVGLKNGDVIRSINGMSIDSPDKALEIYSQLVEGTSSIKVDLQRYGKNMSLDYSIK